MSLSKSYAPFYRGNYTPITDSWFRPTIEDAEKENSNEQQPIKSSVKNIWYLYSIEVVLQFYRRCRNWDHMAASAVVFGSGTLPEEYI
jgi:hypothetical protein